KVGQRRHQAGTAFGHQQSAFSSASNVSCGPAGTGAVLPAQGLTADSRLLTAILSPAFQMSPAPIVTSTTSGPASPASQRVTSSSVGVNVAHVPAARAAAATSRPLTPSVSVSRAAYTSATTTSSASAKLAP